MMLQQSIILTKQIQEIFKSQSTSSSTQEVRLHENDRTPRSLTPQHWSVIVYNSLQKTHVEIIPHTLHYTKKKRTLKLETTTTGKKYDPSVELLAKINKRIETLEKDLMPVLKDTIDPPEEDPSEKKPPPKCPFCWDTKIVNSCTKPEVYTVRGDVVKKSQKPSYIYNIEAGPPLTGTDFSFGIVIESVGSKRDAYDTIGVKDASDVHLRCSPTGGACVQIQTGQLYVKGVSKPQKFSRLPQLGDCIKISYTASNHGVSFTLVNPSGQVDGNVITTTFVPANGGVRPAVAARQIGWGFQLVAGDGSRVALPPDVLIKQVWSGKGMSRVRAREKTYHPK